MDVGYNQAFVRQLPVDKSTMATAMAVGQSRSLVSLRLTLGRERMRNVLFMNQVTGPYQYKYKDLMNESHMSRNVVYSYE